MRTHFPTIISSKNGLYLFYQRELDYTIKYITKTIWAQNLCDKSKNFRKIVL
jgi:hypothetical protein